MSAAEIEALGDAALLLRVGDCIDAATNRKLHRLAARLRDDRLPGVLDIVPAYASLAVHFDPATEPHRGAPIAEHIEQWLRANWQTLIDSPGQDDEAPRAVIEIPVCYGGDFGPDLDDVAAHAGLDAPAVIAHHAAPVYRVAMLGFLPGFPYLLGLDPKLAMSRLDTPRPALPAGAVGIGGGQTGIYPQASPGGWRLLGRTPLRLFDPDREPPSLLNPGDSLRFMAIDRANFDALAAEQR